MKDYYDLLGIEPSAGADEIKQAYRQKMMDWHPDRNHDREKEAEEMTKILNQAYGILGDPVKRKQYDRMLRFTRNKDYGKVMDETHFWEKLTKASPALGRILENVGELYALFKDSVKGNYRLHPVSLGIIGGGLLYFILPVDLVPDYIPFIGYIDDLAVLTTIINSLQDELADYRQSKNN